MKTIITFLLIPICLIGYSQCDDVNITSWTINLTNAQAEYNTNCCPPSGTSTLTVMDEYAGISNVYYNNNNVYVKTTSLAYFTMGTWSSPLTPQAQDLTFRIPRSVTEDLSGTTGTAESGTIGIAVDGVILFSETTSNSYNSSTGDNTGAGDGIWNEDAWYDEAWSMDYAAGHSNAAGQYHYHATPVELYDEITSGHSPIVGWGLDGVPIYGPYGYDDPLDNTSSVVRIESSYQLRNISDRTTLADGTVLNSNEYGPSLQDFELGTYVEDYEYSNGLGHLDEHNGRWCVTPEYPAGIYAYFVTIDAAQNPAYPYFIGPEFYGETTNGSGGYASIPANASEYDPTACVTSVDFTSSDLGIMAYPNPSNNGEVTISFKGITKGEGNLNITDVMGTLIHQEAINLSTFDGKISLPGKSGLYFISTSINGNSYTVPIVKN